MQNARPRHRVAFTLGGSLSLFLASGAILSTPDIVAQTPGAPTSGSIVVAAMNAPVVPDGDVAGRPTEFIVVLDRALDPQVEGRSLLRGKRIARQLTASSSLRRIGRALRGTQGACWSKAAPSSEASSDQRLRARGDRTRSAPSTSRAGPFRPASSLCPMGAQPAGSCACCSSPGTGPASTGRHLS
jgi:hypothetical protein